LSTTWLTDIDTSHVRCLTQQSACRDAHWLFSGIKGYCVFSHKC
jgi:hypothetical protein